MSTTELALPTSGDSTAWTPQEKALVEAAGLTKTKNGQTTLAPRPTVEAFLAHCRRTGLDPIARQIYAIERAGKWGIQVSIDGARLVAERTGAYEGQTPVEWTGDGVTWTQVWLSPESPKAARVGVYRRNFREPLYAVATWDSYAVYDDVWENGKKTGEKKLSSMWAKMGALMLGKCAEMLALRKAFPQDLSGLYSTEEMQQADKPASQPVEVTVVSLADADWALLKKRVGETADKVGLRAVFAEFKELGLLGALVPGTSETARDFLMKAAAGLPETSDVIEVVEEVEPLPKPPAELIVDEATGEVAEPVTEWATAKIPEGEVAA